MLLRKKNGYYRQTLTGKRGDKKNATTKVTICVARKDYTKEKTGERRRKKLCTPFGKSAARHATFESCTANVSASKRRIDR